MDEGLALSHLSRAECRFRCFWGCFSRFSWLWARQEGWFCCFLGFSPVPAARNFRHRRYNSGDLSKCAGAGRETRSAVPWEAVQLSATLHSSIYNTRGRASSCHLARLAPGECHPQAQGDAAVPRVPVHYGRR